MAETAKTGIPKAGPTTSPLSARALTYLYRSHGPPPAGVHSVDLDVGAGERLAVIGPNGSGKSTLLALLAGVLLPRRGSVLVDGEPPSHRRLSYLPDQPAHFEPLTGRENLELFARAASADPGPSTRLLDRFGLAPHAEQPVRSYSFGMKRKLGLAAALLPERPVLILDEPTLGLDPAARDSLAAELDSRASAGQTTVIATNDLAFAERCDRVLVLAAGRTVAAANPAVLLGDDRAIMIELTSTGPIDRLAPPRGRLISLEARRAVLAIDDVRAELPGLIQHVLAAGIDLRTVSVRPADLRDAFTRLTGQQWRDPQAEVEA